MIRPRFPKEVLEPTSRVEGQEEDLGQEAARVSKPGGRWDAPAPPAFPRSSPPIQITGWRAQAYRLGRNHFHLVVETLQGKR
jgi:hypothetical protein